MCTILQVVVSDHCFVSGWFGFWLILNVILIFLSLGLVILYVILIFLSLDLILI